MPPKGKGSKKKTQGVEINGVNTADMTREQLEIFCLRLKEELEREREERNLFQLERDKLKIIWQLTSDQLDDANAEIILRDRQIAQGGDENDEETKKFHQEIKYIQYEHERRVKVLNEEAAQSLKAAQMDYFKHECEMLQEKRDLKKNLQEQEQLIRDERKQIKSELNEDIEKIYSEFAEAKKDSEKKLTDLYGKLQMELLQGHRLEMSALAERKCEHILNLNADHEYYLEQFYKLYDKITMNNYVLIDSLKELIDKLMKEKKQMIKKIAKYREKNKNLIEPLEFQKKETLKLQTQYKYYIRDKFMVNILSKKLNETEQKYEEGMKDCQDFQQYLNDLQQERDVLRQNLCQDRRNFQQKLEQKNKVLQKKIVAWRKRLYRTDAFLREQMHCKKIKPHLFKDLEKRVHKKESIAREAHDERVRLAKMFDDTVQVHEWKARNFGIPEDELGYNVLKLLNLKSNLEITHKK